MKMRLKEKYRRYRETDASKGRNVKGGRGGAGHSHDPQQRHKAERKGVAPARVLSGRSGTPYRPKR